MSENFNFVRTLSRASRVSESLILVTAARILRPKQPSAASQLMDHFSLTLLSLSLLVWKTSKYFLMGNLQFIRQCAQ